MQSCSNSSPREFLNSARARAGSHRTNEGISDSIFPDGTMWKKNDGSSSRHAFSMESIRDWSHAGWRADRSFRKSSSRMLIRVPSWVITLPDKIQEILNN